jgi:hypothetical protein
MPGLGNGRLGCRHGRSGSPFKEGCKMSCWVRAVGILLGDGHGTFNLTTTFDAGNNGSGPAVPADFNGGWPAGPGHHQRDEYRHGLHSFAGSGALTPMMQTDYHPGVRLRLRPRCFPPGLSRHWVA